MTAPPSVWLVVAATLFIVVVALIGFYVIMRLRRRRQALSLELENSKELVEDRAYNQIRLAHAAANTLASRGIDVARCRTLIADAEAAKSRGDNDTALALARSARDAMAKMQEGGAAPGPGPARSSGGRGPPASPMPALATFAVMPTGGSPPTPPEGEPEAPAPVRRLPKNQAESRFQLTLLNEELGRVANDPAQKGALTEGTALRDQAQAASDRGDYTEALRVALKGRRRVGGHLETLPAMSASAQASVPEPAAETLVCTGCGEKLRPNDRFCRYCGTLRGPARCPSCGEPGEADDKFCAKCGASLSG